MNYNNNYKIFIFLLIILFALKLTAQDVYYYYNGRKIEIRELPNIFSVKFNQTSKITSQDDFIQTYSNSISNISVSNTGNSLYTITTGINDVEAVKSFFARSTEVLSIHPIYLTITGDTIGVYDEIILIPKETTNIYDIHVLNNSYNCSVIKETNLYKIINVPKQFDTIELANQYYETGLFDVAEPSFIDKLKQYSFFPNDPYFNKQFALHNIGQTINDGRSGTADADIDAPEAWNITKGSGDIVIAVIDDGVTSNHPDLPNNRQVRLPGSNAFLTPKFPDDPMPDPNDPSPIGAAGHGNSCSGAIAATINNNKGVVGVAPNCKIMPIRINFDPQHGPTSNTQNRADAIIFAADNNADILSCSWGGGAVSGTISEAIQYAINSGVVVLFAASNSASHIDNNDGDIAFPSNADIPSLITVGATDRYDKQTNYSPTSNMLENKIIDICAPSHRAYPREVYDCLMENYPYINRTPKGLYNEGGEIWTIDTPFDSGYNPYPGSSPMFPICNDVPYGPNYQLPPQEGEPEDNLSYTGLFGGTSHSTPVVAGVAALVLSIDPTLTPIEVFNNLTQSADKVGNYSYTNGWSEELGYGRVNAFNAVMTACPSNYTIDWEIQSGEDLEYQAGDFIEANNVITAEANIDIHAQNSVRLLPGFHAESNSNVNISIKVCGTVN